MSVQVRPVAPKPNNLLVYQIMKNKIIFLKDLFSHEECVFLEKIVFDALKENSELFVYENENNRINIMRPFLNIKKYNESQIKRFSNFLEKLTERISEEFCENVVYSHAFLSIYKNKSTLKIHNDRRNLDITLTINIGGLENWPINISKLPIDEDINFLKYLNENPDVALLHKKENNFQSFLTPKGSGIAFYAKKFVHWRDELICDEDAYVMQLFFHWTIIK